MKLALAFGRVNVDAMLDEIGEHQFREWAAYDSISPFGDDRDDLRSAIVASAAHNAYGARSRPVDFLPFAEKPEQSPEDQIAAARLIASMCGARKPTR